MPNFNALIDKLFYNKSGQIVVSCVFGLALALIFNRTCKDGCIVYNAPHIEDVNNKIFKIEDNCYKYTTKVVKCNDHPLSSYDYNSKPENILK